MDSNGLDDDEMSRGRKMQNDGHHMLTKWRKKKKRILYLFFVEHCETKQMLADGERRGILYQCRQCLIAKCD
jgi:hypothetical protein